MGKTPKLKTTLRKAPAKQETPADVTSESSEAVSSNPWATESSLKSPDDLSRQLSQTSSQPQPASPAPAARESDNASERSAATAATSLSQPLEANTNGVQPVISVEEIPKTRRKKTVTKPTPHTFELEDELKSKPQSQPPAEIKDPPKPDAPAPVNNGPLKDPPVKKMKAKAARLNFSPLRTTLNLPPIIPPPPASPRPRESIPNNPFSSPQRAHRKSSSTNATSSGPPPLAASLSQPYRFIPSTNPLDSAAFFNKVVVITHGSSLISSSLIRQFHSAGARVIFGDQSPEKSRKMISKLGPPDIVHFNKCDVSKYEDIVSLFKLAVTMYGRVDHAVFGVSDDGGVARSVGASEALWGLDFGFKGRNKLAKDVIAEVENEKDNEGAKIADIVTAGIRFARVAMTYLKYTNKGSKSKRKSALTATGEGDSEPRVDRSLTFLTSSASIKGIPNLAVYQVSSHAILGIVRSLKESIDPERDGVRINAVLTNVMIPSAKTMAGGRMSVQLPVGRVEDVARVVAGVVGDGSVVSQEAGGGVSGRVLYVVGEDAFDVEDGLRRSEKVWIGDKGKEALERAEEGWTGGGVEWMLMDGIE